MEVHQHIEALPTRAQAILTYLLAFSCLRHRLLVSVELVRGPLTSREAWAHRQWAWAVRARLGNESMQEALEIAQSQQELLAQVPIQEDHTWET